MRTHDRCVDLQFFRSEVAELGGDTLPSLGLRETVEALIDAVPLAEALGKVSPAGTGTQDPVDGIDESAVLFGTQRRASIARLAGQKWLDTGKKLVVGCIAWSVHVVF